MFGPVAINPVNIEPSIINENWPRFNIISDVNFTVTSLLVPCILSSVNVKPTRVLKLSCDHPNLTWEHVKISMHVPDPVLPKVPSMPLHVTLQYPCKPIWTSATVYPPNCFIDQVTTSCMGLLTKGPRLTFAHTEIGGGASFALLNK